MKKNKHELNVFKYDYPNRFCLVTIPKYITQFFRNIKWAYQRAVWGFCERDTFSLDAYYSYLLYYSLTHFANNLHTYPITFEDEKEWEKYLLNMAAHFYNSIKGAPDIWTTKKVERLWSEFENISGDNFIEPSVFKNGYTQEDYDKAKKEWLNAEQEAFDFMLSETKEGFDMLVKVYPDLWD